MTGLPLIAESVHCYIADLNAESPLFDIAFWDLCVPISFMAGTIAANATSFSAL
jgi:hypothetical protein